MPGDIVYLATIDGDRQMKAATKLTYASPEDPFIKSIMIKSIERLTGRRKLQNMYGISILAHTTRYHLRYLPEW